MNATRCTSLPVLVLLSLFPIRPLLAQQTVARTNPRDGLEYLPVPAGTFLMGCAVDAADCPPNELPAHPVRITRPFWLGTTEVTVAAYKRFAAQTHRPMPPDSADGFRPDPGWLDDSLPIVNVSFSDAAAFCDWAGGALPTEAQWELAARGPSGGPRDGDLNEIAWYADNSGLERLNGDSLWRTDKRGFEPRLAANHNGPHHVARKKPNAYGLYDMLGNVLEFTADWFVIAGYDPAAVSDPATPLPVHPNGGHTLRGGHWAYPGESLRASKRFFGSDAGAPVAGFRCMLALAPGPGR